MTPGAVLLGSTNVWKCLCGRCGHVWTHRGDDPPISCAKCKSRSWETPKR